MHFPRLFYDLLGLPERAVCREDDEEKERVCSIKKTVLAMNLSHASSETPSVIR